MFRWLAGKGIIINEPESNAVLAQPGREIKTESPSMPMVREIAAEAGKQLARNLRKKRGAEK